MHFSDMSLIWSCKSLRTFTFIYALTYLYTPFCRMILYVSFRRDCKICTSEVSPSIFTETARYGVCHDISRKISRCTGRSIVRPHYLGIVDIKSSPLVTDILAPVTNMKSRSIIIKNFTEEIYFKGELSFGVYTAHFLQSRLLRRSACYPTAHERNTPSSQTHRRTDDRTIALWQCSGHSSAAIKTGRRYLDPRGYKKERELMRDECALRDATANLLLRKQRSVISV